MATSGAWLSHGHLLASYSVCWSRLRIRVRPQAQLYDRWFGASKPHNFRPRLRRSPGVRRRFDRVAGAETSGPERKREIRKGLNGFPDGLRRPTPYEPRCGRISSAKTIIALMLDDDARELSTSEGGYTDRMRAEKLKRKAALPTSAHSRPHSSHIREADLQWIDDGLAAGQFLTRYDREQANSPAQRSGAGCETSAKQAAAASTSTSAAEVCVTGPLGLGKIDASAHWPGCFRRMRGASSTGAPTSRSWTAERSELRLPRLRLRLQFGQLCYPPTKPV